MGKKSILFQKGTTWDLLIAFFIIVVMCISPHPLLGLIPFYMFLLWGATAFIANIFWQERGVLVSAVIFAILTVILLGMAFIDGLHQGILAAL